jgi:DNA-binding beta-propeller fold protein YncE
MKLAKALSLVFFSAVALAAGSPAVNAEVGSLRQKAGTAGCLTDDGTSGQCTQGRNLMGPLTVIVSPDGKHVYGGYASGIEGFERNQSTGALSIMTSRSACFSYDSVNASTCNVDTSVVYLREMAISPDGKNIYASGGGIGPFVIFDRDTTTGLLTRKSQCFAVVGTTGCTNLVPPLFDPTSIVVSPDGKNVYVADSTASVVYIFARASDGSLSLLPGSSTCLQETTANGCAAGGVGTRPLKIVISPDGGSVYIVSRDFTAGKVSVFDRAADGSLTRKSGATGCFSSEGVSGCATATAIRVPSSIAISPDGKNLYVGTMSGSIGAFRRAIDGTITQKGGLAACVSQNGTDGNSSAVVCSTSSTLGIVEVLVATEDGRSVYATNTSGAKVLSLFTRNQNTGELHDPAAPLGCITSNSSATSCTQNAFVKSPGPLALSPNQKNLYLVSFEGPSITGSITSFVRETGVHVPVLQSKPAERSRKKVATFTFTGIGQDITFQCRIDAGSFTPCTSPVTYRKLKVGKHSFEVQALRGATKSPTASFSWRVLRPRRRPV